MTRPILDLDPNLDQIDLMFTLIDNLDKTKTHSPEKVSVSKSFFNNTRRKFAGKDNLCCEGMACFLLH